MASTGLKAPTSTGEDYNQWTNPADAYTSNNSRTFADTVNKKQDYYNFSFGLPTGGDAQAIIDGVEVVFEAQPPALSGGTVGVELSWDGGTSYTSSGNSFTAPDLSSETNYTVGGASTLWGHSWNVGDLTNTNFRLRINANDTDGVQGVGIDQIQARVYYHWAVGMAVTSTGVVAIVRSISRTLSATAIGIAGSTKFLGRVITATAAGVAAITQYRGTRVTLGVSVNSTATITRRSFYFRILSNVVTVTTTVGHPLVKNLTAIVTGFVNLVANKRVPDIGAKGRIEMPSRKRKPWMF